MGFTQKGFLLRHCWEVKTIVLFRHSYMAPLRAVLFVSLFVLFLGMVGILFLCTFFFFIHLIKY